MKVIISAGGTMGHINPALAIIDELKRHDKNLSVIYIGTHNRMEKDIIPKLGIKYIGLEIYGFSKKNIIRDFKNIFLIKKSIKECINIMNEFKPDIVIGVGGYVTYPVIKAAKTLHIPSFIHEQNSIPGKSNIMLSKYADCIGVSFKNSEAYFTKAKRVVYTGNPCGELAKKQDTKDLSEFGFKKSDKVIIIVAGSLGSESFNNKFKAYLSMIGNESYKVLYIAGKNYYEEFMKDNNFSKNVKVIPYYDNLSSILGSAYLIISRAGASTLSEIVALKKPSILIPSPYVANNHQYYNALDLANLGVAELIEEKNLNANMIQVAINELVYNKDKYNEMLKKLDKMNEKSSSNIIYDTIKELIK